MIWSFVLAGIGIAGVYLAGNNNYWGWGLGVIAQVLWAVYAVVTGQWGFLFTCFAYAYIYGKNFLAWSPGPILRRPLKIKLGRRQQIQTGGRYSVQVQVGGDCVIPPEKLARTVAMVANSRRTQL